MCALSGLGSRRVELLRFGAVKEVLGDGMVDSFAEFYPKALGRYTCLLLRSSSIILSPGWDQYRNKRHENEGSRIDYILVVRGQPTLLACCTQDEAFFQKHASAGAGPATLQV